MTCSEGQAAGSSALEPSVAALAELSAQLASGGPREWEAALQAGMDAASDTEIEETLLQAHLFVGFPVVLDAFIIWRDLCGRPAAQPRHASLPERRTAGEDLCREVYGKAYRRLRDNVRSLHPDLDRWMVEEGYGRTLSRPGLPKVARELCVVALLAAAGHDRQLRSHLLGAVNVGADRTAVGAALEIGVRAARGAEDGRDGDPGRLVDMWQRLEEGLDP